MNQSIRITAVEGNRQRLDGGAMFGNAPRALWEKWTPPDELGRIDLACRCMLLQFNDQNILFEAGIGAFFDPKMAKRFGVQNSDRHLLIENLARLGIGDDEIDYVILSHLHFDHAGGLMPSYKELESGVSGLKFPKAQYVVGELAWERALNPHSRDQASFIPDLNKRLSESGRLQILEQTALPANLAELIEFRTSNGHTPGQQHALVKGQKRKVFFAGDLIPGRPWVHSAITMGYDRYPEKLIDEKVGIYKEALAQNWIIFFTHDSDLAAAEVSQSEKGRYETGETFTDISFLEI